MRHPRRICGAFTLIELLVVISIIAMLIAILLPALQAARQSARQIQCGTQQRQMGIALMHYANDAKGNFPIIHWGYGNMFNEYHSSQLMRTYIGGSTGPQSENPTSIGSLSLLLCPNHDPSLRIGYVNYASGSNLASTYRIVAGYGNSTETGQWHGWASHTPLSAYSDATPIPRMSMAGNTPIPQADSNQPIIGDLYHPDNTNGLHGGNWFGLSGGVARNNHVNGNNTTFLDGHVSFANTAALERKVALYYGNCLYW